MITKRPTDIQQFLTMMERFRSAHAQAAADNMESLSTDVFISTFAKSGTTWMQQITHQLRTSGDDSFDDIYEVVPWIENALDMGVDLAAKQSGLFRVFKSHMSYESLPESRRYIAVFRNPSDVVCSWFRFFEGWLFETGSISLDAFAREFYLAKFENHQTHYVQWIKRMKERDTLILCYEDMVEKADEVPGLVADFLDININPETMQRVVQNSSRDYMYRNRSKFEERLLRSHIDSVLGLPACGASTKVNKTPTEMLLGDDVLGELAEIWHATITAQLGFENYNQLRAELPNPLKVNRERNSTQLAPSKL